MKTRPAPHTEPTSGPTSTGELVLVHVGDGVKLSLVFPVLGVMTLLISECPKQTQCQVHTQCNCTHQHCHTGGLTHLPSITNLILYPSSNLMF